MSYVPVFVKPYPDELLYSWFYRMADANCLSLHTFMELLSGSPHIKAAPLGADVRHEFPALYKKLIYKSSLKDMYLKLSTFSFEALFMSEGQQTRYINNVFRKKDALNPPVNCLFQTVKVCEECMEEDRKLYGKAYLHRSHQLSGVCTCYKHKTVLGACRGKEPDISDYEIMKPGNMAAANSYTQYAQSLFESGSNGNIYRFKKMIFDRLRKLGYGPADNYQSFEQDFGRSEYKEIFQGDIKDFLKVRLITAEYVTAQEIIPVMLYLYQDVNEVISTLNNNPETVLEKSCEECGNVYCTTPMAVNLGFGCPECEAKTEARERYAILVKNAGKGQYEVMEPFESLNSRMMFHHKECGCNNKMKSRSFIFEGARCRCEYAITFQKAKAEVEKHKGYQLIEFTGSNNPVKIRCEKCGHEFECSYFKFLTFPGCRVCKPKHMTAELYEERVYNLVGDEYSIIEGFKTQTTKVVIKHNRCGQVYAYKPSAFLDGQHCRCSTRMARKSEISWEKGYELLCQYKKQYGNTNIPKRDCFQGCSLGIWCQKQRDNYKVGKLTPAHKEQLDSIGFEFTPYDNEWNRRYEQYKRYIEWNGGNTAISRRTDFEGEHLGAWVETQRKRYKINKLPEERINSLLELDRKFFQ